eukprot:c23275_g1_i1 orf=339-1457(+)
MGGGSRGRGRRTMDRSATGSLKELLGCRSAKNAIFSIHGFVFFLFLLQLFLPSFAESNADRVGDLLQAQSRSPDGVIRLDDNGVRRFVQEAAPRPYSLVIFFDALHLRDNSKLGLGDLRREFGLMASTYVKNNQGTTSALKVFFVDIEFKQSQWSFALFEVNSLPYIKHLPPGSVLPKEADVMDQGDFSRIAEGMASFVESKTKQKVGSIERPPPVTNKQLIIFAGGLLVAAPFVIKKILAKDTPLHDPKVWCSSAIFVYFFSVSGGMHNIIRKMPFVMADRQNPGKIVFFYQGSGMQLGAEGFVVGFLYTIVGLMLAFLTHFLVVVRNPNGQRLVMFVMMVLGSWAVRNVVLLDHWKTGYGIHGYWPRRWQ